MENLEFQIAPIVTLNLPPEVWGGSWFIIVLLLVFSKFLYEFLLLSFDFHLKCQTKKEPLIQQKFTKLLLHAREDITSTFQESPV